MKALFTLTVLAVAAAGCSAPKAEPTPEQTAALLSAVREAPGPLFGNDEFLHSADRICRNHDDKLSLQELSGYGFTAAQLAALLKAAPAYCGKGK